MSASVGDAYEDEDEKDYDGRDTTDNHDHPHTQSGFCIQQKQIVIKQYTVQKTHHVKPSFCRKGDCSHKVMPMSYFLLSSHFLYSPIFSVMSADVSRVSFRHSSHLHFPLSSEPTSGMVRWAGRRSDVRDDEDCSGGTHRNFRSEGSGWPRPQVRLSCWPEINSVPGEEMTGERWAERKNKEIKNIYRNKSEMHVLTVRTEKIL